MVEHRLLDDAGTPGDLHHADVVEATLGEQVGGRVDDPGPRLLPLLLPDIGLRAGTTRGRRNIVGATGGRGGFRRLGGR
jgi:hypothetical protein